MQKRTFQFSNTSVDYYLAEGISHLKDIVDPVNSIIITDENIFNHHQKRFKNWNTIVLKAGEEFKVQETVDCVIEQLIEMEAEGTYTDRNAEIQGKEYSWNHSLSEVLNALINHGLRIEFFNEYSYSPYPCFKNIVQGSDGNWRVKGLEDKIPMVYSVKANKR